MKERSSKKRDRIIEVFKENGLVTANDLVKSLPELDPATIYRNINRLVEKGTIKEYKINRGVSSYEYVEDEHSHQHFICDNCQKVYHLDISEKKLQTLLKETQFKAHEFELNIRGECSDCK